MRYHSLIFSAISNTPILAIAYQPKVSQLASRLGIQSYNPHEENIPIKFENAKNTQKLRQLASKNFSLLKEV